MKSVRIILGKCLQETNGKSVLPLNSFDGPSTSAMSNSAQAIALEEAPTVPDVDMEENQSFDSPSLFYPVNGNLISANLQADRNAGYIGTPVGTEPQYESQPMAEADSETQDHTLPSEELSFPLNFPENYCPTLELLQSLGRNRNAFENSLMVGQEMHADCGVKGYDVHENISSSNKPFGVNIFNELLWEDQPMDSTEDLNGSRF